jgi:hypothetical protein
MCVNIGNTHWLGEEFDCTEVTPGPTSAMGRFPGISWIKLFPRVLNDDTASVRSVDVTDAYDNCAD